MSKELEKLKDTFFKNIVELQNNAHDYDWEEINNMAFQIEDYVIQILTPPTADEVCKELIEYYKVKVIFERGIFYKNAGGDTYDIVILNELFNIPHLIKLIGEFYIGVMNNEMS